MYKVDHSEVIEESVQSNVRNEVINQIPKFLPKAVSNFINPRIESTIREVLQKTPAFLAQSFSTPGQSSSRATGSSKGKTPPKTSKTDKSVTAKELVEEPVHEVAMDVEEPILDDVVNDANQPQHDVDPKNDKSTWFKQSPKPKTPDYNGTKTKVLMMDRMTWFNDLVNVEKDSLTFDELMATPIDFTKFAMNRLKLDKITKADLVGSVYKLLKGTFKSCIELEYNMNQRYNALMDQLDWTNPGGDKCDFSRLRLNDIEDMLLLHVQNKLFNLPGDDIVDLVNTLRMFTQSLVIKKRVEDIQLGVESYQKKLNITKPQNEFHEI
uniref:Uncharacterized protein n=1 Tax=Tanacetum cinerariifolium TaxID=118510 RepID=A0A6L2NIM8_TANCI|nr:hypothetical protein [Tanacetum cinerariifolium]